MAHRPGELRCLSPRCGPDDDTFGRPARRLSLANSASPAFCLAGPALALDPAFVTVRSCLGALA
jgi:hypothetical protein